MDTQKDQERPPSRGRKAVSKPLSAREVTISPDVEPKPNAPVTATSSDEEPLGPVTNVQSTTLTLGASPNRGGTESASGNVTTEPRMSTYASEMMDVPLRVTLVQAPLASVEPPQITAKEYPWLYMSSTLEACLQDPEPPTSVNGKVPKPNSNEEPSSHVQTERAERVEFEEKQSDHFLKTAPIVMQAFHLHGDVCTSLESEALNLALNGSEKTDDEEEEDALLQKYHEMLDRLERQHAEGLKLEASIVDLTNVEPDASEANESSEPSARSQLLRVVAACLPVIRARITNLSMAQELVDGALENFSISLRMESLGIE